MFASGTIVMRSRELVLRLAVFCESHTGLASNRVRSQSTGNDTFPVWR